MEKNERHALAHLPISRTLEFFVNFLVNSLFGILCPASLSHHNSIPTFYLQLTGQEGVIDIPEEYVSIRKYRASLAHKTNHSFNPNAVFSLFEHPR